MEVIPYILATAGHVDHGKSALVRALTGIDPDRLPEEKARGITIELGFAPLRLPSPPAVTPAVEYQIGIVDVPGHEDFVRNMVAGIGSIDAALLVVAADDGWMPQTEEHLQILMYLGVTRGVVALTKIDLVENPALATPPFSARAQGEVASTATAPEEAVIAAIRAKLRDTPLADAPIVPTSILTGRGLAELKAALADVLADTSPQPDLGKPRLPVDRAFVLKGIGTVVTGTLTGGSMRRGEAVVIQPSSRPAKVRTVQTHNHEVEMGRPRSRVALNLPDLTVDTGHATGTDAAVRRGDVITLASLGAASKTIDVLLHRSPRDDPQRAAPLNNGVRVHVHHGSGDSAARVYLLGRETLEPGESTPAQLRFESPVFVFAGDRVVIRDGLARHTLAGGVVLDPQAARSGFRGEQRRRFLERRAAEPAEAAVFVATQIERDGSVDRHGLLAQSRFAAGQIEAAVTELARAGRVILVGTKAIDTAQWQSVRSLAVERIDSHHKRHPEQLGPSLVDLRQAMATELPAAEVFDALVTDLCRDGFTRLGAVIRRTAHRPVLPPKLAAAGAKLRAALAAKLFEPPSRRDLASDPVSMQALKFLLDTGEAIAVSEDLVLSAEAVQRAGEKVREYLTARGQATASDLKQALGTTRRVMMPLLEFLDAHGLTQRRGDLRVLRGK